MFLSPSWSVPAGGGGSGHCSGIWYGGAAEQSMRYILVVIKKELRQFVYSPIAYIVAGVFHSIMGFFFYNSMVGYSRRMLEFTSSPQGAAQVITPTVVILEGLFNSMGTIFLLLTPLITMRLVAGERRGHTMEMMLSSPLSLGSIVMGKFFAALSVYSVIILMSIYMPIVVDIFAPVNWAQVGTAYLGLFFMGASMISVGLLASTVTDKQVVAAVLSIGILVIFWFVGGGIGAASMRVSTFMRDVSLYQPFSNMITGLLDMRDAVFFLGFSGVMLFLSHRVLESGRM